MAIKKSDLSKTFTEKQRMEIERFEKIIDDTLREEFADDRVIVTLKGYPDGKVEKELVRRYREAGWKIQFHSEQMGGNWVELA